MNQQTDMTTIEEITNELKKQLPCIQSSCDLNGTISSYSSDGELELEQCQYCDQVRFPLIDWLTQTLKDYGDAIRGKTLNDVEEALKQWWGKDLEEGHAYADDYIAEGTTLSGDIIPVIRSLKGTNE